MGKVVNGQFKKGWLYQDQLNPVAELDSTGQVVSRFVYGTKGHVPDFMVKGDSTYWFITDHLGSVRLVVNVGTDHIAQRLDYDEFGNVLVNTNEGFQPFGYAGGAFDEQTGLVRFGARDYDAGMGRWTAKDPIIFGGKNSNLYLYCMNDPLNYTDPSGLKCKKSFFERVKDNFVKTNEAIPGLLAPTGTGLLTASAVAKAVNAITIRAWVTSGFSGTTMGAATFTGLETGIVAAGTYALNFAIAGLAFETGVGIGSIINAAIWNCDEFDPCK